MWAPASEGARSERLPLLSRLVVKDNGPGASRFQIQGLRGIDPPGPRLPQQVEPCPYLPPGRHLQGDAGHHMKVGSPLRANPPTVGEDATSDWPAENQRPDRPGIASGTCPGERAQGPKDGCAQGIGIRRNLGRPGAGGMCLGRHLGGKATRYERGKNQHSGTSGK